MIPECKHGFSMRQIDEEIFVHGPVQEKFWVWMRGQTMMHCNSTRYNYDTKEYERDCDEPHGVVVYPWDLKRYLDGRHVID